MDASDADWGDIQVWLDADGDKWMDAGKLHKFMRHYQQIQDLRLKSKLVLLIRAMADEKAMVGLVDSMRRYGNPAAD